jgi:ABC-type Fe2+-enterobactin transport system substrate-binding protein
MKIFEPMRKIVDNSLTKSNYIFLILSCLYAAEKTNEEKVNDFRNRWDELNKNRKLSDLYKNELFQKNVKWNEKSFIKNKEKLYKLFL